MGHEGSSEVRLVQRHRETLVLKHGLGHLPEIQMVQVLTLVHDPLAVEPTLLVSILRSH